VLATGVLLMLTRSAVTVRAQTAGSLSERVLDNGLTVVVESRPWDTVSAVALLVRAGERDDPPDRPGLLELIANATLGGTLDHPTRESLTQAVSDAGGTVSVNVSVDLTSFLVRLPSGAVDGAVGMLAEAVEMPRFSVADVGDALRRAQSGLSTPLDGDLMAAMWPQHPAAVDVSQTSLSGSAADRNAITFSDVLNYRQQFFGASNMVLSVAGPVDPAEALDSAAAAFATLPAGQPQPAVPADPGAPKSGMLKSSRLRSSVAAALGGSLTQTQVQMALAVPGFTSPDYPAVTLLALALSGPSGRLFQDVRSTQGLAYDVDARMTSFSDIGALIASATVDPKSVEALLARFRAVLTDLQQHPPDAGELSQLRARLRGQTLVGREQAAVAALQDGLNASFGRPLDIDGQMALYDGVTPDDLSRVAEQYLSPDRAVIAVRGP
jgi:zinc protease